MDRREFVRLVGLASSASLLGACGLDRQTEKLIPYLVPPDDGVVPGKAVYFRTTCTECPANCGMTARVIDRRVVKLEGIESHPVSDGALCMRGQASIARLYHPARLKGPLIKDANGAFRAASWDEAYEAIVAALKERRSGGAEKAHVFLSSRTTETLSRLIDDFCSETEVERLPEFELFSHAALREANKILFGLREVPSYRLENADWLLTIGADMLETMTNPVSHAVQYGRATRRGDFEWVHVEPHYSLTGARAGRRLSIAPGGEVYLLAYMLREASRANLVGERRIAELVELLPQLSSRATAEKTGLASDVVEDITSRTISAVSPLVVAGGVSTMQRAGLEVALLTGLLQWSAGMIGRTVIFDASSAYANVGSLVDLDGLSRRLVRGEIGVLICCATDPLGTTRRPYGDSSLGGLAENLGRAAMRVGLGEFMNPTLQACDVVLPLSHTLECWGDARPSDGVRGIIQPAVEPVHDTTSAGDVLLELGRRFSGAGQRTSYQELLIGRLKDEYGSDGVEAMLGQGYVVDSVEERPVALDTQSVLAHLRTVSFSEPAVDRVLIVAPSIRRFDGRGREIALLDEVPDPVTTVTYGGWLSAPAAVGGMRFEDREEVTVSAPGWSVELPVKVQPGLQRTVLAVQYDPAIILPIAFDERCGELIAVHEGVAVRKTGRHAALPILSGSLSQRGRGVIPSGAHEGEKHDGEHAGNGGASFYSKREYEGYRWAMAIDVDLCTGCSACVAACYVENNVPVTGLQRHLEGREMSWLRVEPFYRENGEVDMQLMLCQHCGNAPCETVCPVYAAYHNPEGLNAQVYNRCVGTRYCANNCPYKVRRFNWFDFKRETAANPTRNSEVSVRGRGVMEKCSFCVQRIRVAREKAKDEKRKIKDGEVIPACAQTCPTEAIVFGNLNDETSKISKKVKSGRPYRVFESLGTEPAVYYFKGGWKNERA